jgi:hypothetical protein
VVVAVLMMVTASGMAAEEETEKEPVLFSPGADTLFSGDTIDAILAAGEFDGEIGIAFRNEDPDDGEHGHAGWAYLDVGWESGSFHGLQVGMGGLFVTELWTEDGFEDLFDGGGDFEETAEWTEAYLKYTLPSEKTSFILGRADDGKFGEPATGDGDYYEGLGVRFQEIPRLDVRAHVVKRWIDNASASWDLDGIDTDWAEMNDAIDGAEEGGDLAYTLMATIGLGADKAPEAPREADMGIARVLGRGVCDCFNISPYVQTHSDVGTSYGVGVEAFQEITKDVTFHFEGNWASFSEDTEMAGDDDFNQWIIHPFIEINGFTAGVGYYAMSDDVLVGNTTKAADLEGIFIVDEMDPMEEDAIYGEHPNSRTLFFDVGYSHGPFSLGAVYGIVDDARIDMGGATPSKGEATELDISLEVAITKNIDFELFYADVQDKTTDDDDGDEGGELIAGAVSFSF